MRESSREKVDFWAKEEEEKHDYDEDRHISLAQSTSRRWSAFRNPRIVRVSRALGGKDRHSKVCTVRGVRDRRIRLSVNTAVELYDLQDKLGVSQPSKVIDYLLEVSKHDIDKLPPLQVPSGFAGFPFHSPEFAPSNPSFPPFFTANFPFLRHGLAHHPLLSRDNGLQIDGALSGEGQWTTATGDLIRAKGKEVDRESSFLKKTTWIDPTDRESEGVDGVMSNRNIHVSPRVSFLPMMANFSSHISSQFGSHHGFMPQTAHHFSQSRPFTPSIFPAGSSLVVENNFQPLSSGSNSFIMPSLHSTVPAEYVKLLRPENRAEGRTYTKVDTVWSSN